MFQNEELKTYLETESNIESTATVIAEINMNDAENISIIGNYRNRSGETIHSTFGSDETNESYYKGYTDSDIVVDGGIDTDNNPVYFTSISQSKKLLFSLEDCFGKFRPRSGINKAVFFDGSPHHYIHNVSYNMMERPRYYMPDKDDKFKYWTSFRKENVSGKEIERGIASTLVSTGQYSIDDAAPFIVYKEKVPVNRIVVKIQTNIGTYDAGSIIDSSNTMVPDPLYDAVGTSVNRTVPVNWKIQYLKNDGETWSDLAKFNVSGGLTQLFEADGYLELHYTTSGWVIGSPDPNESNLFVHQLVNPVPFSEVDGKYQEFQYINGLRIVVNTMSKKDSTFDLIELSPRLAVDLSDITTDYSVNKIASDLGVSGMPVGQLLVSTGSLNIADFDQALNVNNVDSVIAKYIKRNVQVKLYEIIKNVSETASEVYVPIKTMYIESFPEIKNDDRTATIVLRDLYFYFESLTCPQIFIQNTSFSYAIAMILDSIGFSNYIYLKSDNDPEPIIQDFFVAPDTSVAEVLQDIARSTQTAMFFDEYNNLVLMSRSYMMAGVGDRPTDTPDLVLYGNVDSGRDGILRNKTTGPISNIVNLSNKNTNIFNGGKITYNTRYIQRTYSEIRQAMLSDQQKTWTYKPVLLWEVTGSDNTKSINEERGSQSSYTLSAIPLNSNLTKDVPVVVNGVLQNNTMDLGEGIYWISRYTGYFYSNGEIIKYDAVEYNIPGVGNEWISSVEEYQSFFEKIPFGGKMYPTGLVRIYAEPNYVSDTQLKSGEVAKHGRGQFGTQIVEHNSGISDSHWVKTNINGCYMKSDYLFSDKIINKKSLTGTGTFDTKIIKDISSIDYVKKGQKITGTGIPPNTKVVNPKAGTNKIKISNKLTQNITDSKIIVSGIPFYESSLHSTAIAPAGTTYPDPADKDNKNLNTIDLAKQSERVSTIRNFLSSEYFSEILQPKQPGTLQSSALVMTGPSFDNSLTPIDFISYVYKDVDQAYNHFGTRVRIVGSVENSNTTIQSPTGSSPYFSIQPKDSESTVAVSGSSGGLGIFTNSETNNGYYFEIAALTAGNIETYLNNDNVANVLFYKIASPRSGKTGNPLNPASHPAPAAIPTRLWTGLTNILVDDGKFTGQGRVAAQEKPTVYDLAVEYQKVDGGLKFFLYMNNKLVGTVIDPDPLPVVPTMSLFVRGSSKCMFENIYAIGSANPSQYDETPLQSAVALNKESVVDEAVRNYSIPEPVQATYLSRISPLTTPANNMYFEEFGTIMRETAYFNIRYDKAYPALYAKIAPTFNKLKGYAVSGFVSNAYGAEFLVFNTTDSALSLDSTSGNYLRIIGVTFTQESQHEYTVDEYFANTSDFSNPEMYGTLVTNEPLTSKRNYQNIKNSRITYGKNEFNINATYIQSQDSADNIMSWFVSKILKPRKSVGMEIFPNPMIQLGDIVNIDYVSDDVDAVADSNTRFVVYNIQYSRKGNGPSMTLYLSEVTS